MARFHATTRSEGDVAASRADVWAVLTDPAKIARMTPLVTRIDDQGETWLWHMQEVKALGVGLTPTFTERMTLEPQTKITFAHDRPDERVGVDGVYELADAGDGVHLSIALTVSVELPLPRASSPAVTSVMKRTMQSMGDRFAARLRAELGVG